MKTCGKLCSLSQFSTIVLTCSKSSSRLLSFLQQTLMPQAYAVNLTLIRSFIPFSGTDGRLRAVKYLGSPERPEERSSMVLYPLTIQPSVPVIPFEAVCAGPFKGSMGTLSAACGVPQAHVGLMVLPSLLPPPSFSLHLISPVEIAD